MFSPFLEKAYRHSFGKADQFLRKFNSHLIDAHLINIDNKVSSIGKEDLFLQKQDNKFDFVRVYVYDQQLTGSIDSSIHKLSPAAIIDGEVLDVLEHQFVNQNRSITTPRDNPWIRFSFSGNRKKRKSITPHTFHFLLIE